MSRVVNDKYRLVQVGDIEISHSQDKVVISGYGITHAKRNGVLIGDISESTYREEFRDAWVGDSMDNPEIPKVQHALAVKELDHLQWDLHDPEYICASYMFESNAGMGTWREYEISNYDQSKMVRVIDDSDEPFTKNLEHMVEVIWRLKRL